MQTSVVTHLDRQRGWAELEIKFTDGKHERVRVHVIEPMRLPSLLACPPENQSDELLKASLRVDPNFIARICLSSQFAILAMLAQLCAHSAGGFTPPTQTTHTGDALNHG